MKLFSGKFDLKIPEIFEKDKKEKKYMMNFNTVRQKRLVTVRPFTNKPTVGVAFRITLGGRK